jgi:hypothetical protein
LTLGRPLHIVELGIARMSVVCPMWRESICFEDLKANHRDVRPHPRPSCHPRHGEVVR